MKKIFHEFTKGFEKQEIEYWLLDHPVAIAWYNIISKKLQAETYCKPENGLDIGFPKKMTPDAINNMIFNRIENINSSHDKKIIWPKDITEISQDTLNRLHQEFHETEEHYRSYKDLSDYTRKQFIDVNYLIHSLENQNKFIHHLKNPNTSYNNYRVCKFGSVKNDERFGIPVTDELVQYFKPQYSEFANRVKLTLGYSTIGKDLGHCVIDNDVEVVKSGLLRPQKYIRGEHMWIQTIYRIRTEKQVKEYQNNILERTKKWVSDNNLSQYVDLDDPHHKYTHKPELAYVADRFSDWTEDQWWELWSSWTWTGVRIG